MNVDLFLIRLHAFAYEAGSLLLFVIVGALASPQMEQLVTNHWGDTMLGSLVLLALNALVKHLRNLRVLKEYENKLGSGKVAPPPQLL